MISRRSLALALSVAIALIAAPGAHAATVTVDDDGAQCPGAPYTSIQTAVDAAFNGDTVAICPGTYVEGNGASGGNALTVGNKSLTLRGAGADLVTIRPKRSTATGGQIAEATPDLRNGVGDIVSVVGSRTFPVTVDISGVTVDGNGVYSEAGVVYRDGGGTILRSRVTNIVTSESNTADTLAGGYRFAFPGVGIAQVTTTSATPSAVARPALNVVQSRISRYNRIGVLIDSAINDTPPLTASPVTNTASLSGSQVIGRTQCTAFNTPTPPPYVLGGAGATPALQLPGNCSTVSPTTVGPTFGQDGVRVTSGSTVAIKDSTIVANLVHGTGAPLPGTATNNANLPQGAGVRLIGAGASSIATSNLNDNAYGVLNTTADGTTANAAVPVVAENDFWGLRVNATQNAGPAVSPATNPPYQETAVNGAATADATCQSSAGTAVPGSDAVDFCPFRNGNQADPNLGQLPVAYAPLPVSDAGPVVTSVTTDKATYNRGETVTVTATATDDFALAKFTFLDGGTVVGTAVPPANSATFTIPADAACTSRTVTVVAQDSTGQTASASTTFTVTGPNNCQPVGPFAKPTVELTGVGGTIPTTGKRVGATASVDPALTVTSVVFKLGARTVCTDRTAPYACTIRPRGRDTGRQSVTATVTDSNGQTATDSASVRVKRFKARAKLTVKRTPSARRLIRTIRGRLTFAKRVSPKVACASGTVTMTVRRNGKTVLSLEQVNLRRDCTYKLRFKVRKRGGHRFAVTLRFGGNDVLLPARTQRRFK